MRRQGEKKLISEVIDTDKHTHTHGTSFRIALRVFERKNPEDNDKRINYPTNKARDERKCTNNYIIEFHCNPSPTPNPVPLFIIRLSSDDSDLVQFPLASSHIFARAFGAVIKEKEEEGSIPSCFFSCANNNNHRDGKKVWARERVDLGKAFSSSVTRDVKWNRVEWWGENWEKAKNKKGG